MNVQEMSQVKADIESFATGLFGLQGEVLPMFHVVLPDEKSLVIMAPFSDLNEKELTAQKIGEIAREKKAQLVVFMCEAWMAHIPKGEAWDHANPIADHPDRIEALILAFDERSGSTVVSWPILRDEKGVGSLGERSESHQVSGRFVNNLLPVQ